MEVLYQIACMIFFILFFCWAFFKIRNIILVKKMNCTESYKNIKKGFENQKLSKYLYKIAITFIIIFVLCIEIGIILWILSAFMMLITLGGTAYVDTGADPTFYNNLLNFTYAYFKFLGNISYFFVVIAYIIILIVLVKEIYVNIKSLKKLKSDDTITNSNQELLTNISSNKINRKELLKIFIIIIGVIIVLALIPDKIRKSIIDFVLSNFFSRVL